MTPPSDGSLRVLQLTAPSRFGGLETVVRQLSTGLHRRGHEVRVVSCLDPDVEAEEYPFVADLRRAGIPVTTIQAPRRAYWRERSAAIRVVLDFQPDVIHSHGYHADVIGAWVGRGIAVPRVSTAHGFTGGGWKNRLYERLQRRSYRSAAGVIAVSPPLAESLRRDPAVAPLVRYLANAWVRRNERASRAEARTRLGLEADGFVVGWVGRMGAEKGPDVILRAMSDPAAGPITLCMVGDGALRPELEGSAVTSDGARVVWTGLVPDAGRLFAAFDLIALSSRTEGTPMVLLEAMDARVPVVATSVGGIPDVVGPREALLVPPEDPAALREAVLDVYRDPAAAARRAMAAAERLVTDFGPEAWFDEHERLYRDAMAAAGAARGS